ncbi:MAG TPA: outer membrane beta-barrel protein [Bryobacteraceae bacterium]|jgi:opacity protein-like surface antigen
MSKKIVHVVLFAGVILTQSAFAQEGGPGNHSDATVQALGSFVKSTNQNGIPQDSTNSGGVLATYRYFFDQHNGVEVNYGYERNTQSYGLVSGPLGVGTNNHEVSVDYVLRFQQRRWTPFVLAGAGALVFDPRDVAQTGLTTQTRAAFVYGGGADFHLTNRLFLRAEYRGFVYNSPTYDFTGLNGVDRVTHRAEPSIGFGYRF